MPRDERRFELPGIHELTQEQDEVLERPKEGRHLVVGGPGTGKTVVCLLRARRHAGNRDDYMFLVWPHLLLRASRALFEGKREGKLHAATWKSWFWGQFWRLTGRQVPTLATNGGGRKPEDWTEVDRMIRSLPDLGNAPPNLPLLVIDEGQDMPPGFYDALNQLGFASIFVAADQNQQIKEDENSSREELTALVGGEVVELTYNHRNEYPIARLAREFYTGDPASPPPELPSPSRTVYTPRLYYVDETRMPAIAGSILRHWDQNPRRLIGVIAPNNAVREKYHEALGWAKDVVSLDNGHARIETFHGEHHRPEVRFDRGGVLVINAQACKGLEFDTVVLADINEHLVSAGDPDRVRKLFYVMVSRARERVVMFMKAGGSQEIEDILPKDDGILRREDITAAAVHGEERG